MADNESIDIMESVFGTIVLPNVQVQELNHHHHSRKGSQLSERSARTPPVPKQRHDISNHSTLNREPVLARDPEFRASFIGSEHGLELNGSEFGVNIIERQTSKRSSRSGHHQESEHHQGSEHHQEVASLKSASIHSKSRHDSTISRKSEPIYNDVHSNAGEPNDIFEAHVEHQPVIDHQVQQVVEQHQPHVEPDRVSNSSKLPRRNPNTDQVIAELRSRQNNELGYDQGTISTSKTSELANEYELYSTPVPASEGTEVNEQTDDSGTETEEVLPVNRTKYLFDSKDPYLVEHDKHPDTFQQELGQRITSYKREVPVELQQNTVRSNASQRSGASDFIVSIFENNTQERVRAEVGSEINLDNLKQMFESSNLNQNGHVHLEGHQSPNKHSYKHFIGKNTPEPRVLRSGSIASMTFFGGEDVFREPIRKLQTLSEHEEANHFKESQHYFQHRQAVTSPKPADAPQRSFYLEKIPSQKPSGRVHPIHQDDHHHYNHAKSQNDPVLHERIVLRPADHHSYKQHVKPSQASRRSVPVDYVVAYPMAQEYVRTPQESRRSTLIEHHHNQRVPTPQESRRSTLIEHHHNQRVLTPQESRRSTLIEHHHHENSAAKPVKKHHHDLNNNVEAIDHVPVSKLCTLFEQDHHMHQKNKRHIDAPVSPAQTPKVESFHELEKHQQIPLLSRVVISDDTAHGKGNCSPGSIAALHKTVILGNPNARPSTPASYHYSVVDEEQEPMPVPVAIEIAVHVQKRRKPKTLAAFYDRWGQLPPISSEI